MAQTTMFLLLAILLAIMVISTIIIIIVAKRMKRFEKSGKMQDEFYEEDSWELPIHYFKLGMYIPMMGFLKCPRSS